MFPMSGSDRAGFGLVSAMTMAACLISVECRAQSNTLSDAPTVARAAKVLNLETFPRKDGAGDLSPPRLASLSYDIKDDVQAVYRFQKTELEKRGWTEAPGAYLAAEGASATFTKANSIVSVSVFPTGEPGKLRVSILQHGGVDLSKLPVPPGSKPLFQAPINVMYVNDAPADEVRESCRKLLLEKGWEPYGVAGDSLFMKKEAVILTAFVATAPAQGNKTSISYSTLLVSADLPAPPGAIQAQYADITKQLLFDSDESFERVVEFYRARLGKGGWKSTTENPVSVDRRDTLIFANPAKDVIELQSYEVEGKLRVTVTHQSAAEVAELTRLAKAAIEARKKEMEAREANRPKLAILIPKGETELTATPNLIEYQLPAGSAKAAVEALRTRLLKQGWTEDLAELQPMAGTVSLSKDPGDLTITYVDTGFLPAEIAISATGIDLTVEKAVPR